MPNRGGEIPYFCEKCVFRCVRGVKAGFGGAVLYTKLLNPGAKLYLNAWATGFAAIGS